MDLFIPLPLWLLYKDTYCTHFGRFGIKRIFWKKKSWVYHILRDISPFHILEWCFITYLLMTHRGHQKGKWRVSLWGFISRELGHKWRFTILLITWIWVAWVSSQFLALILILWDRLQVTNHHLIYLMNMGGVRCCFNF